MWTTCTGKSLCTCSYGDGSRIKPYGTTDFSIWDLKQHHLMIGVPSFDPYKKPMWYHLICCDIIVFENICISPFHCIYMMQWRIYIYTYMIRMTHNDVKQTSINEHIGGYFKMVLRFVAMIASPQRTIQRNGESLGTSHTTICSKIFPQINI